MAPLGEVDLKYILANRRPQNGISSLNQVWWLKWHMILNQLKCSQKLSIRISRYSSTVKYWSLEREEWVRPGTTALNLCRKLYDWNFTGRPDICYTVPVQHRINLRRIPACAQWKPVLVCALDQRLIGYLRYSQRPWLAGRRQGYLCALPATQFANASVSCTSRPTIP